MKNTLPVVEEGVLIKLRMRDYRLNPGFYHVQNDDVHDARKTGSPGLKLTFDS